MAEVLSTREVAAREQFSFWREIICDVFVQLDCERLGTGNFAGRLVNRRAGPLQLTEVGADAQHVVRSRRQIAKGREDDFLVSLQLTGTGVIAQDGREAVLRQRDFALYDSTRPYELHFDEPFSQLVIQMPRAMLRDHIAAPERLTAVRIPGSEGTGAVVADFLAAFAGRAETLPEPVMERVAANALDLLATGLWTVGSGGSSEAKVSTASMRLEIKAYIEHNLRQSGLSVTAVAQAHGISRRYLRTLFEEEGVSPRRYLWDRRFERARAEIADPRMARRSVTDIAFAWGFNDLSHFSRGFRDRFGLPPRAYREAAARDRRAPD